MKNLLMACVLITLAFATAAAQQAANQFEIIPIRNNVYMLAGDGGNIALSVGPDGVLVVDTGTPANSDRLVAAVQQLQQKVATNGLQAWSFAAETRSNLPRMIEPWRGGLR